MGIGNNVFIEQNGVKSYCEIKHIQSTATSSRDSFKLQEEQAKEGSFDYLILLVSKI